MIRARFAPDRLLLAGAAALALISAGCANNVDLGIIPKDKMAVSLQNDIQPIFTRSCTQQFCHGAFPQFGLDLRAGSAWDSLVNVLSAEAPLDRVEPGYSALSYLVHKLEGTQASVQGSGEQMPFGMSPLPDAEIQLIRSWIDQGAANN